jgi:hypothetical protein
MEPWGRIVIGVLELIASIMLLKNKTRIVGAFLTEGLMLGAIYFHIKTLGFVSFYGSLFLMAVISLICVWGLIYLKKDSLKFLNKKNK